MAAERKPIHISPDSELGVRLRKAAADDEIVLVDTGEAVYTLAVHAPTDVASRPGDKTPPRPEQVAASIERIRRAAGAWKDIDGEALKAYIYERRRTKNRPPILS